jgi:hypothetical protein
MSRVRYVAGMATVIGLLSLAASGCGGGDDKGSDATTASSAAPGGDLFTQTTHTGTLKPIAGQNDVFTLTLDQPSPDVTVFTDRPVRSASTQPVQNFVDQWDGRGFNTDPPNAALVLDQEPDSADTAIFELTHPTYDKTSGAVSYTARHVNGATSSLPGDDHIDPPPSFSDAHLFIDPSGGGDQHAMAVDVNGGNQGEKTQINFDTPWNIVLGPPDSGASYVVGPNVGGGFFSTSEVSMTSAGGVQFTLQGGTGAITGTATVPRGATVGIQVDNNPEQTIKNGSFSLAP